MPRMARVVVPGYPHHITQRGSRCQQTFFEEADYQSYLELLMAFKAKAGVEIWAYCLMPNHVHLVVLPHRADSLAKLFGRIHPRYARRINVARGWQGHLWQERFHSFAMDERHLLAAVRYVELNPVRAGLCRRAHEWQWSSVHAHLGRSPDTLLALDPMRTLISNWSRYLAEEDTAETLDDLRKHTRSGRPAGDDSFVEQIEALTGRKVRPRKPGPSPKQRVTVTVPVPAHPLQAEGQ